MRGSKVLTISLLLLPLAGCPTGPTQGEVVDRFAPQLAARLADIKAVLAAAPAAGAVTAPAAPVKVEPTPVYKRKAGTFTMDIVAAEQIEDPTFEFFRAPEKFDLNASEVFQIAAKETAPGGLSADDRTRGAYELYPQRFEKALGLRYVAVVRTVAYEKAVAVSESAFTGGLVKLEVLLVDTQDKALEVAFPVEARPAASVEYMFKTGQDRKEQLASFARSSMWEDARKEIEEGLRAHAGADVAFE